MNRVYRKQNFNVYQFDDEYIIHNMKHDFKDYHTHIRNYKTCIFIIDLVMHKSIPHHLNTYLLRSLIRLSDDEEYCNKIQQLIDVKNSKRKDYYFNPQKGTRKSHRH